MRREFLALFSLSSIYFSRGRRLRSSRCRTRIPRIKSLKSFARRSTSTLTVWAPFDSTGTCTQSMCIHPRSHSLCTACTSSKCFEFEYFNCGVESKMRRVHFGKHFKLYEEEYETIWLASWPHQTFNGERGPHIRHMPGVTVWIDWTVFFAYNNPYEHIPRTPGRSVSCRKQFKYHLIFQKLISFCLVLNFNLPAKWYTLALAPMSCMRAHCTLLQNTSVSRHGHDNGGKRAHERAMLRNQIRRKQSEK